MKSSFKPILFILSSPSGGGKTTVREKLIASDDGLLASISCTSRLPRTIEKDGFDYEFIKTAKFEEMIQASEFLEYAQVHGYYYGTPKKNLQKAEILGKDLLLTIDVQGAWQVKEKYPASCAIMLLPPSRESLYQRLKNRATENNQQIETRLITAAKEIQKVDIFDYLVINDDLRQAVQEVQAIISACRCHREFGRWQAKTTIFEDFL